MNSQDKKPFLDAMMAMGELYNRELSTALVSMYFDDLSGYGLDSVLNAFRVHRMDPESGKFFPKPSDIREKIEGGDRDNALGAWPEVMRLATNSREAKSSDVVTESVVQDMGGWRRFGLSDTKELGWMQKEFIERYQAKARRPQLTVVRELLK